MRHRFALPVALLFSLALLVASRALAEEAKPVPEVALVPSAPAGALSPAEAEKLRLLEAGLLSPALATQAALPVPAASGGAPEMSSDGRDIICYYQLMTSGLVDTVPPPSPPSYFYHHYQQPVSYWSAVGVRSAPGDDWDIELYAGVGAVPPCVDTLIGYSNRSSGVDFVVGDFNHVGASEDYVACSRYSGLSDGLIEWDDGADVLVTNAPPIGRSTGPTDILEVWDIYLETGKNYSFLFESTGSADMKLLLFRNTGSGAFYLGRNGAEWEQAAGGTALYSPGSSDWYGLVVVNDNGESGTYTLEAGTCLAPVALSSAASVATPAANGHYSCDQSYAYWSAVGVRGDDPAADWDVSLYSIGSGASWPTCFTGGAGLSADFPGQVDFVARDFNAGHNPFGYFYAHAHRTAGAGQARTEWDDGGDLLALDVPAYRSTGPNDVLETWDVYVEKNVDYNVYLERSGADVGVVVIPPIAYGYWGNRHDGLVDSDEPCAHFLAGDSAYYAVVAVNDDGGSGDYGLAVGEQFVDQAVPPFEDTLDSRGISAADFDDDGDLDLYLTVAGAPDKLFRNDGTGYFTEVLPSPFVHSGFETGAVWGDYDNDGDLDVFVVVNAYGSCRLYRNDGGNFTDVTQAPLDHAGTGQSASWSDYDRDGFLDLFVAYGGGDRLYHNERDGTFSIATPGALQYGEGRDGAWGDYDNDGDPDLYVAKSALSASQLLRNDDGTFVDATPGALAGAYQGIASASWVDYDNDQDLDLFVADEDGDHLFRSDGGGAFTNVSAAPIADSTMSLAHVWTDYDNDSDLDLFLPDMTGPARLIRNLWAEGFDGSFVSGLGARAAGSEGHWGITAGSFYLPGGGSPDIALAGTAFWIYEGGNRLLQNRLCRDWHWLDVRLAGICSNKFGVGARITVWAGTYPFLREVAGRPGDCSYISHFGLGIFDHVDMIEVRWPSGVVQEIYDVAVDQRITIEEDVSCLSGVETPPAIPRALALHANIPNPFNPATTIRFDLPAAGPVRLAIYDVTGRLVRALAADDSRPAGRFEAVWDGRTEDGAESAAGIYFCRLEAGERVLTRKMALIR